MEVRLVKGDEYRLMELRWLYGWMGGFACCL